MKNKPLAVQIWFLFAAIMAGFFLLLLIFIPWTLRSFFTQDIYTRIEDAQTIVWSNKIEDIYPRQSEQERHNIRMVRHILWLEDGSAVSSSRLPSPFINEVQQEALKQKNTTQRYVKDIDTTNQHIFYVIRKGQVSGKKVYLLSYMSGAFQTELVQKLLWQLMLLIIFVLLISWLPSLLLAKYLSRSLVLMEKHVKRISNREWHEPFIMNRKDEIGRLAQSIERMRQRLVSQDKAQQSLLQNISHELQTPVMVIQSYAGAIQDGIYPKGDLAPTVKVIMEESKRLEKQIKALLYLNKLNYLSAQQPKRELVDLKTLLENNVDRLRWSRNGIDWKIDLAALSVLGDGEQLAIALENLLDNQLRYSKDEIVISLQELNEQGKVYALLRIWNNGIPIEAELMNTLFQPFHRGKVGQFGLGLAIVQRIAILHEAKVWAANEQGGVAFYLKLPLFQP